MIAQDTAGDIELPGEFLELTELRAAALDRALGYFGDARYVIFGYCPGGAEVVWKDGKSSGFGAGGWKVFLAHVVPAALRCDANVGTIDSAGTHVLLLDRRRGVVFAAARESAEDFLATVYRLPPTKHRCLCGLTYGGGCTSRNCGPPHDASQACVRCKGAEPAGRNS